MKYTCNWCNFASNDSGAWCRHKKSIKHQKSENLYIEKQEKFNLKESDEIKQLKDTINTIEKGNLQKLLEEQKNNYENQIKQLKKFYDDQKITMEKTIDRYEDQVKHYRQIIDGVGGIVKKSMSTISYLIENYNQAPQLTKLSDYSVIITQSEEKFVKELIYYKKKDQLHKYLGNFIIKMYKKKNPKDQSIWNTDCDRLSYLIRDMMCTSNNIILEEIDELEDIKELDSSDEINQIKINTLNKKSNKTNNKQKNKSIIIDQTNTQWIADKKGIKVIEYIITPFLKYINEICKIYLDNNNNLINDTDIDGDESRILLNESQNLAEIITMIINGPLANNINKYIASYFYFNLNK